MFPEYLHRTYQALVRGRKPRSRKLSRAGRQTTTLPTILCLEDRTLLSTLTLLFNGNVVYAPATSVANALSLSYNAATQRYTVVDTNENITLTNSGAFINPSGNGTHTVSFWYGNISWFTVNMGNQNFTVNIEQTVSGRPVYVNLGGGTDAVNISPAAHNLDNIQGAINVQGGIGIDSLNVYDQSNAAAQTFSLGASSLSRSGSAAITYGTEMNVVTINGGNGNNTYNVTGTEDAFATTLNTGNGQDTVNVSRTGFSGTFTINEGTGGDDVNLGATVHSLNNVQSTVRVNGNHLGVDNLTVDDQGNSTNQTFTLNSSSISRTGVATIQFNNLLNNIFVLSGTGGATVNVLAISTPTSIICHANGTTVNIGNAGSVQQILGPLTITDPPAGAFVTVNVDDSADSAAHSLTLDTNVIAGSNYGRITGLAPAAIQYKYQDTSTVTVDMGTGAATVNILSTGVPVNLSGHGPNTVNVGNAGSVQAINGSLVISGPPSLATVNVDDSADNAARTVILDTVTIGGSNYGRITGLAPAVIEYVHANTTTVTVQTGTGGALVNILATGEPVSLIGHGSNTVVVGNAGSVQAINGPVTITDPGSGASINVIDSVDATFRTVSLDTVTIGGSAYGRITGLGAAAIEYKYADTNGVAIDTGTGGANVNVLATGVPVYLTTHGGATVNVGNAGSLQAINGPLTISGAPTSPAAIHVDDLADSAAPSVTLDTVTIAGSSYGRITGLAPAAIQYKYSGTNSVSVQTGSGGATVSVLATGVPVVLSGDGVNTTFNIGNAGSVQGINGPLTISNLTSVPDTVNVDDSADATYRTVTLDTVTIGGASWGRITGLAPAAIQYRYSNTSTVSVQTGSGGAEDDVLATGSPLDLIGYGGSFVNIGNAGSVQAINAPLMITNAVSTAWIAVDDSADGTARIVNLDTITVNGSDYGRIMGLGSAPIDYRYAGTFYAGVQTGIAGGTVNVLATGAWVGLGGTGSETVNVGNAGSVQAINGGLTISGASSFPAVVNVDDSADGAARTVTLDTVTNGSSLYGSITGLAPAAIWYNLAGTSTATVQTGSGGGTVNVLATGVPVSLVGAGNETVNVGNAGNVQAINGPLTISGAPSSPAAVNVDDSADGAAPTVTLDTVTIGGSNYGRIAGLAPAVIEYNYAATSTVTVQTGTGGAMVNALATGVPVNLIGNASGPISLFASDGDNTWNITSQNAGTLNSSLLAGTVTFSGAPNLHGGNGADTFVFADGAGVDGTIDGGSGTNALDYSAYSSSVLVNLQTGFASGVGGGIANIQNVTGGTGGGAGTYNILVGNGGNVLTGGDGRRNLLIAGASASTLIGGNDDDILIGGTTVYDTQAGMVSLQGLMNYWSNTADDYATRVVNLLNGTGVPRLDATIAHNNGGGNTLMGNHGAAEMNLFYGMDPTLETTDYNPTIGEQFINC
jgi:hypothetical protein